MEENVRAQEELSLAEIIWILWRRIKFIILALVVGLVAGAGIAALKTYDVHYYGTNASFYVNPYKDDGATDQESQYGVYGAYGRVVMDNIVRLLSEDIFAEKIGCDDNGYPLTGLSDELNAIVASSATAQEAVEAWRETAHYKSWISSVKNSISYSYYDESSGDDVDDLAKSFIYVKISVLNDENFATFLFERIKTLLPQFVSANMAIPSGYDGTNCRLVSTASSIGLLNAGYAVSSAVKYGLIAGAAALVLVCIVVIVIDRSDQRLRNYELVMERLQIPVLGVIPCIEDNVKKKVKANTEVQK